MQPWFYIHIQTSSLWHIEHILIGIYAYIYHAFQSWHHICTPTISCLVLGKKKHGVRPLEVSTLLIGATLSFFIISRQIKHIMCRLYISNKWSFPILFQFSFLFICDHWWSYGGDQIVLSKRTKSKMFVELVRHPLPIKLQVCWMVSLCSSNVSSSVNRSSTLVSLIIDTWMASLRYWSFTSTVGLLLPKTNQYGLAWVGIFMVVLEAQKASCSLSSQTILLFSIIFFIVHKVCWRPRLSALLCCDISVQLSKGALLNRYPLTICQCQICIWCEFRWTPKQFDWWNRELGMPWPTWRNSYICIT